MKNIYLQAFLLVAIFAFKTAHSQTKFEFTYDASGNRLTRKVITLKSATISIDSLKDKQAEIPLDDQIGIQNIRIYPNPTKGMLRINLPNLNDQMAMIRIYDSNGKQIVQKLTFASENEVDLSCYPSGNYIMVIHIKQDKKEWKIIKE